MLAADQLSFRDFPYERYTMEEKLLRKSVKLFIDVSAKSNRETDALLSTAQLEQSDTPRKTKMKVLVKALLMLMKVTCFERPLTFESKGFETA